MARWRASWRGRDRQPQDIGAYRLGNAGIIGNRLHEGLANEFRWQIGVIKPLRDAMHHRRLKARLLQNRRQHEGIQRWFLAQDSLGIASQP